IGDRARDPERKTFAGLIEGLLGAENGRLGVQCVEHGFDQDEIGAPANKTHYGIAIGIAQFIEADVAESRIVHVWRQRGGAVRWTEHAGHKPRSLLGGNLVADPAREYRA